MNDKKIIIVGAGAAGISTAYELKKKGYENITVLEKDKRIGGKCLTVDIEEKNYELGAVIVGSTYTHVREYIKEAGVELIEMGKTAFYEVEKGKGLTTFGKLKFYLTNMLPMAGHMLSELRTYKRQVGYAGINKEELGMSFEEWLNKRNLSKFFTVLASCYVSWGYGFFEEVAAAYVVKLLHHERVNRTFVKKPFSRAKTHVIAEGYQGLLETMAKKANIDVQLDVDIKSIKRNKTVKLKTNKGNLECDTLIVACPPNNLKGILDEKPIEDELINKIKNVDFRTFACKVDNLDIPEFIFCIDNLRANKAGHSVAIYKRWDDSNIVTFGNINVNESTEALLEKLKEDVHNLGGSITEVVEHVQWEYFPHVEPSEIKTGYYDKLETLQGENSTYYSGEFLAFSAVEYIAEYSKELVNKHF
ncbi:MAG: FAD-dependent oxidoreductase [bacterium]|nr:FAD-dependent oxidoreductase [bacterium]